MSTRAERGVARLARARRLGEDPSPEGHQRGSRSDIVVAVGLDNPANRKSLLLPLSLLVFGVVLATWLIPSVGTAGTAANVADVVGTPITRQGLDHWMFVTAKSSASRGEPVIVPADPPKFTACITRVRETSPRHRHDSEKTLRDDCRQLFVSLRDQVLDFLITADWLEHRAFTDHIAFTPAQVRRAFAADKREQFQTPADFRAFLTETGQTIEDVIFRVRVNLIYEALLNKEHLTPAALSAEVARLFKSRTRCARYYAMSDCVRA